MNLQSLHVLQRPQLCSEHAAIPQLHHGPQSPLIREFPTFIKEMKVKILTPMKTAENRVNGQSPAAHPTVDADTDQHSLALHLEHMAVFKAQKQSRQGVSVLGTLTYF